MTRYVYTDQERHQVLTVLALNSGNVDRTVAQLNSGKGLPFPVPAGRTVRTWRGTDEYTSVRDKLERVRDERHAEEMSDLLAERIGLLRMAHGRIREKLEADEIPARDLANLDRNLATSAGILNANSRINREKPLGIIATHGATDLDELFRTLGQHLGRRDGQAVDGTAEDALTPVLPAATNGHDNPG